MAKYSKRERVEAALAGEPVDRVPVSAWRHFIPEERSVPALTAASLRHFQEYDWDWLKLNPRATYYAEAWGNRYDYEQYHGVLPRLVDGPLNSPADLERIEAVDSMGGVFGEQLEQVRQVRAGIGDAHLLQTVFSPLSVLAFLAGRSESPQQDKVVESQFAGVRRLIRENPEGTHAALQAVSATLAGYAAAAVEAGASGLFYAIVRLARQGVLTEAEYAEFGRPYDLQVLQAVQGAPFNMLHICGPYAYFDSIADYPVHAVNWAAVGQHNPTVGEAAGRTRLALVGGVDEEGVLQHGTPQEVIEQASEAIRATGGRGFLLAPGCGAAMDAPAANLHALRWAVEPARASA